jgi:RNA-directed DNA polymerase
MGYQVEWSFDRVNHDVLMSRLARRISDKRVLRTIRRYLQAGMMTGGVVSPRTEGTPQGGPLSPLMSNVLLDELDKELERRGHKFCRYADDCNIYVRSRQAGERVMASVTEFLEKRLRLKVNREKSAVARPWERKFLGYSMTWHKQPRLKVAESSIKRLKEKVRVIFREGRGRSLSQVIKELNALLRGWMQYFRLAEVKGIFDEAALSNLAAMEEAENPDERTDQTRIGEATGLEKRQQRARFVVECWCVTYERSIPKIIL